MDRLRILIVGAALALLVASCGAADDGDDSGLPAQATSVDADASGADASGADASGADASGADASGEVAVDESTGPSLVVAVTTNILGDVVTALIGDQAEVFVVMPVGADPHDFQPSAQEVDRLLSADIVIANGAGFEEGLTDVIESARDQGVPVVEAIDFVETIEFGTSGHDHSEDEHDHSEDEHDHSDDAHSDDAHSDDAHSDDKHEHSGVDPHFFTDPARMTDAVIGISAVLAETEGIDAAALQIATDAYLEELASLDAEVSQLIESIPNDRRVLVTNHNVFGYVAERFDFEVVGVIVPGGSTGDAVSAGELAALAEDIEREGVPAIFVDTSSTTSLAETLAGEVGDIEIVELYSESLGESGGEGDSYLAMVRTNASRIAAALG